MTVQAPCEAGNPEDWFIEKDGLQYHDEPFISDETEPEDVAKDLAEQKREALIRRRQAKQACHTDCPVRLQCLTVALDGGFTGYGIWGGYYPNELAELQNKIAQRRRGGVD